ncbi:MAG: SHOCT domain-containing protein [Clostridiales bacterium]|nr:SHOCT domain-containing protein [Clostridiales bacterium]
MGIFSNSQEETKAILQEKKRSSLVVGTRMYTLFYILIAGIVIAILHLILKYTFLSVINFGVSIAFGVVTLTMPDNENRFRKAGICYILSIVFSFIGDLGFLSLFMNILAAVAGIVYIFSFVDAASDVLISVDDQLSDSWQHLRVAYSILYISLVAAVLLALMRLLLDLALLVIAGAAIAAVVFQIWMMVTLKRSGDSLCSFANRPIPEDLSNSYISNGVALKRKPDTIKEGWQCVCGKYNPMYSHTCSCGKTKAVSDREKAEKRAALKTRTSSGITTTSASSDSRKNVELLKELKGLLDQGVITQEEFDAKKAELLRNIK